MTRGRGVGYNGMYFFLLVGGGGVLLSSSLWYVFNPIWWCRKNIHVNSHSDRPYLPPDAAN